MEKNKLMMIIIIALLVVLLASVGAVSFFAIKMFSKPEGAEPAEDVAQVETLTLDKIWSYSLGDPISTNLRVGGDGEKHVIKAGVTVAVNKSDEKDKEYIALIALIPEQEKIIRALALNVMRKKTYEELNNTSDGQTLLAEEILKQLQESFNTHLIIKVYVNDMILQ